MSSRPRFTWYKMLDYFLLPLLVTGVIALFFLFPFIDSWFQKEIYVNKEDFIIDQNGYKGMEFNQSNDFNKIHEENREYKFKYYRIMVYLLIVFSVVYIFERLMVRLRKYHRLNK